MANPSDEEQSLIKRRDRDEHIAKAFAWLIVIGLAVELWFTLKDNKLWPDAIEKLSGTFLILLGVAGEIIFGGRSGLASEALRQLSELRVAQANRETERLRAQFSWRRLELSKFEQLRTDLRRFATVIGVSTISEPEAATYADDIAAVLQSAGYDVRRQFSMMPPRYDVSISDTSPASKPICDSLRKAGIDIELRKLDWATPPWINSTMAWPDTNPVIFVGLRPRPSAIPSFFR